MDSSPDRFSRALEKGIPPLVLVACVERLDQEEVGDAVIQRARGEGFTEREVHHVERKGFPWPEVLAGAGAMSLFGERRIIDVRCEKRLFDKAATQFLHEYVDAPPPDTLLLVRTDQYLNKRARNTAWYQAAAPHMLAVHAYHVKDADLPSWLNRRAQRAGLRLTREATEFLALRLEGNLLAAAQEISRLALRADGGELGIDAVRDSVANATHYQSWDLVEAAFAGDAPRVRRMCASQRAAGETPLLALASIVKRLREGSRGRSPLPRVLAQRGPEPYLAECALIDQQAKGALLGDAWQSLERLLLALAGTSTTPSLSSAKHWLNPHG